MSKEAMKLALEALKNFEKAGLATLKTIDAITALKQALSQPEPEPVECHTCKGLGRIYMGCGSWIHCDTCNTTGKATTQPKREPEPEPVAVVSGYYGGKCVVLPTDPARIFNSGTAFYTHPPKREWQGLTDDEIKQIEETTTCEGNESWLRNLTRNIEAKLKEKNGGLG